MEPARKDLWRRVHNTARKSCIGSRAGHATAGGGFGGGGGGGGFGGGGQAAAVARLGPGGVWNSRPGEGNAGGGGGGGGGAGGGIAAALGEGAQEQVQGAFPGGLQDLAQL